MQYRAYILVLSVLICTIARAGSAAAADAPPTAATAAGGIAVSTSVTTATEYTPTGDALWDTYAQALLARLETEVPDRDDPTAPPVLDDAQLAKWEPQFGADPRYWQLRWWNASVAADADVKLSAGTRTQENLPLPKANAVNGPLRFLREAQRRGVVDAATTWLLYRADMDALGENATVEQQAALADKLVAANPNESRAWYERAMGDFERGDWDAGLADLRKGNAAPSNSVLLPFPASFVRQRIVNKVNVSAVEPASDNIAAMISFARNQEAIKAKQTDADLGSGVAAGIVVEEAEALIPFPNFIRLKDHWKDEEVRLSVGAPLSEIGTWHEYACRFGAMDGADSGQWLVAEVISSMITHYLLVDAADALDTDQREAVFALHGRMNTVRDIVRYEEREAEPKLTDFLTTSLTNAGHSSGELAQQVLDKELWPLSSEELDRRMADMPSDYSATDLAQLRQSTESMVDDSALISVIREDYFRWWYARDAAVYGGDPFRLAKERFTWAFNFDWDKFAWKPEAEK